MSAFDATIRVGDVSLQLIEDESGKSYEAQLILGVMALAPVGPNQAIPVPFGALRVPLDKKSTQDLIAQLQQADEQLSERVNIDIAGSMAGVDQAAKLQAGLRA